MPLEPIELAHGDSPRNTPDYIDENPNRDLILEGMEVSENERREAVEDEYGLDPSLPDSEDLDDTEVAPEISAIHETHSTDDA